MKKTLLFAVLLSLLFSVALAQNSGKIQMANVTHQLIPINGQTPVTQNADFNAFCDSIKAIHDSPDYMGRILCHGFPELPYHNGKQNIETAFLVDAVFQIGDVYLMEKYQQHADLAILNFGGIRTGFPAGNLTYGNLFDVLCFDNYIAVQKFSGAALIKAFEKFTVDASGTVVEQPYSHVKIVYHKETGEKDVFIGGQPIDSQRIYWVVSLDFILGPSVGDRIFENIPRESEFEMVKPLEPLRDKMIPFLNPTKISLKMDDRVQIK